MQWARHKHAPWYLSITAFIESVFWPIPVDVMLAPMAALPPSYLALALRTGDPVSVLGRCLAICSAMPSGEPVVQPLVASGRL